MKLKVLSQNQWGFTWSRAERHLGGGDTVLYEGVPETNGLWRAREAASQLITSEFGVPQVPCSSRVFGLY